jgi:hypothetical protein
MSNRAIQNVFQCNFLKSCQAFKYKASSESLVNDENATKHVGMEKLRQVACAMETLVHVCSFFWLSSLLAL